MDNEFTIEDLDNDEFDFDFVQTERGTLVTIEDLLGNAVVMLLSDDMLESIGTAFMAAIEE